MNEEAWTETLTPDDGQLNLAYVTSRDRLIRRKVLAQKAGSTVIVDCTHVLSIDSAGVAWLAALHRQAQQRDVAFCVVHVQPRVQETLDLFPYIAVPASRDRRLPWLEALGDDGARFVAFFGQALLLEAEIFWFTITGLFSRHGIRWHKVAEEMSLLGSRALGIVALISFLVGVTITIQGAVQLRRFGANIFVVDLIGLSITRELGPLITAIVVAGRSGSAVAAELATMKITEEVDAVKVMGFHPARFLVLPKMLALTLTQPVLTMFSSAVGIFGGFLVAVTYLDLSAGAFLERLQETLEIRDLLIGVFKAALFAQLIVLIASVIGLNTRGGADAVGKSTTSSVVVGIFAVITTDALCSLIFYLGD